jgi:AcrR family transcriptional regulator
VKSADDRRNEILDGAQALFFERGYERTTVNDVIAKVGISKGGFYHHFTAKEDLLEAITARLAQDAVARVRDILDDPALDALERLNAFLARSRQMKLEDAPKLRAAFDVIFRPENLLLYHRINAASIAVMRPVLSRIIVEGTAEGVFAVPERRRPRTSSCISARARTTSWRAPSPHQARPRRMPRSKRSTGACASTASRSTASSACPMAASPSSSLASPAR